MEAETPGRKPMSRAAKRRAWEPSSAEIALLTHLEEVRRGLEAESRTGRWSRRTRLLGSIELRGAEGFRVPPPSSPSP